MPAYNVEKYVGQALEAILRQTYAHIEIIAVNDGSTDKTRRILLEYAGRDKRLSVIDQPNRGLSAARNAGFAAAKGEYLCIIDSDDLMLPQKIESHFGFLEQHRTADIAYSRLYLFVDGTTRLYTRSLRTPDDAHIFTTLLQHGNFISPNTVFFRRSVLDRFGGFDENLRACEDIDYWLSLSQKGANFLFQDEYLTLGRMRKGSLTTDGVLIYSTLVTVFEKYIVRSSNAFLTYLKYPYYLRSRLLLWISKIRKSRSEGKNVAAEARQSAVSMFADTFFSLLYKMKFRLTFKKARTASVRNFLAAIQSLSTT